jgi:putative YhdH/YhfP family quinone oxidoreductase
MIPETFRCYLVKKTGKEQIEAAVERRPSFELPAGEVVIQVAYSALNYKDALAATGHPGVARSFPHVPGIDVAGTVLEGRSPGITPGTEVVATSYELGVERWGGWAELVRVPAAWVLPLPEGLTLRQSMILGTGGLTAGLCVRGLRYQGVMPDAGEVVVTGATGGVGSLAVQLLAKLGYSVVAVSGKAERHDWLKQLGAARVVTRDEMIDDSSRPLLSAHFAGAVDTVGGKMLATLLRSVKHDGCVACCGLVGGAELSTTVYPFILRGVTLAGIDSAWCPRERRLEIWNHLSGDWRLDGLDELATDVSLEELEKLVPRILEGRLSGRTVVEL